MTERTKARLAWCAFAVITTLFVVGVSLSVVDILSGRDCPRCSGGPWEDSYGRAKISDYFFVMGVFLFPLVGVLIATRKPNNWIGWILLAIGFVWGMSLVDAMYIRNGLVSHPGSLPRPDIVLAIDSAIWVPGVGLMGTFLILLFPDGKLPSRRWRPVAWLAGTSLLLAYVVMTLMPGDYGDSGFPGVENPFGIEVLRPFEWIFIPVVLLIPISIAACTAGLITRFRRSRGVERLQMKWLATAAAAVGGIYVIAMFASVPYWVRETAETPWFMNIIDTVSVYSFALIPVAIGIAILRYRLFDIDIIVNRTLVYATLTGILTIGYVVLTALFQSLLTPLTRESDLAVAASTLAIAALFRPARRTIQRFIDHRFYRRKYNAAQTIDSFSARLRGEIDLDSLTEELVAVVGEVMQPQHVSVWLRDPSPGEART